MTDRRALLDSMVYRLEAAVLELQSVAHDATTTGLPVSDELLRVLEHVVHLRDYLHDLAQATPPL